MKRGYNIVRPTQTHVVLTEERDLVRVPAAKVDDPAAYNLDIGNMKAALSRGNFAGQYPTAYALAHHQVAKGGHAALFVIRADVAQEHFEGHDVILNPEIVERIGEPMECREGCMSHPYRGTRKLQRHMTIRARWNSYWNGKPVEMVLTGLPAMIFQHEYDHTRGRTIWVEPYA